MNFRPVTLIKEFSDFSKNPWPRICKKTQKMRNLYRFFLAQNNLKGFKICPHYHLWSFRWISGPKLSKKNLVIFQKNHDPGYAKKLKKWEIFTDFFGRNNLKSFKIRPQHHLWSFRWISGPQLSKKNLVIFQKFHDPGHAKKLKQWEVYTKIIFASKQP